MKRISWRWMVPFAIAAVAAMGYFAAERGPRGVAIEPRVLELGTHEEGAVATEKFVVTNRTSRPVRITDIRPDCGCLMVTVDGSNEVVRDYVLPAGGSVAFRAGLNTSGYLGDIRRHVRFRTDAAGVESVVLPMTVRVEGGVRTHPSLLHFGVLNTGDLSSRKVVVSDAGRKKPLKIGRVASKKGAVQIVGVRTLTPRKDQIGSRQEIETRLTAQEPGPVEDLLLIYEEGDDAEPIARVPLHALVEPEYVLAPSQLVLPRQSGNGPLYEAEVLCRNTRGRPFELAMQGLPDGISVQARPVESGGVHRVRVSLDPSRFAGKSETIRLHWRAIHQGEEASLELPILIATAFEKFKDR